MKMLTYVAVALFASAMLTSCSKDDGEDVEEINPEYVKKAEDFKLFVQSKSFQIDDYYSDKPIDYIETDSTVKSETNLWNYVSPWLKDDYNVFDANTNKVTITQNDVKIPGNNDATIVKDINIGADKNGPYFNFLSHEYQPLRYHLVEFSGDHFVVYADWHSGEKVYTKFVVVNP